METKVSQQTLVTHHESLTPIVFDIHTTDIKKLTISLKNLSHEKTFQYVILNMHHISTLETPAWFREVRSILKQHNMILIGVRDPQLNLEFCKALKIPVIEQSETVVQNKKEQGRNLYLEYNIRSGQQIYAEHGTLVINKNVNAGSEVAARGDVHVYGKAQGKILAGVKGNLSARIFINCGYPELISIAGITLFSDDIRPMKKPCVFMICNGQLVQAEL